MAIREMPGKTWSGAQGARATRLPTGELLWGRLFPAMLFEIILLPNCLAMAQRVQSVAGSPVTLAVVAVTLQQALGLAFGTLMVVLFAVRRPVVGQRSSPLGAVAALLGTFALNAPIGARVHEDSQDLLLLANAITVIGLIWALVSLAFLGRYFGLFPEARGLVTRGPYRWIRHPLYLGELTTGLGLVVARASLATFGLFLGFCCFQYIRMCLEERALREVFPEYADYQRRSYRILPGIY